MISRLTGKIVEKTSKYVVVETSGIGYKVYSTPQILLELVRGEMAEIQTHLIVRENALDLYGFLSTNELNFFELLIGISGIGPKGALGVLSVASVEMLNSAISSGDTSYLTKVSGIGKKSAEKIILELKDKIEVLEDKEQTGRLKEEAEAIEALKTLGYKHSEARDALKGVSSKIMGVSERVREALRILGT